MVKSSHRIRFDDEQPTAADFCDPVQFPRFTNLVRAECSPPSAPEVFFILATNKPLEIDAPYHVSGTHEIQCRERDCNCRRPTIPGGSCLRSPNTVPARIAVLR